MPPNAPFDPAPTDPAKSKVDKLLVYVYDADGTRVPVKTLKITNLGGFSGDFTSVTYTGLSSGQTATFNATTGFINIVPEPTAAALVALGAGLAGFMQRRKRRTA